MSNALCQHAVVQFRFRREDTDAIFDCSPQLRGHGVEEHIMPPFFNSRGLSAEFVVVGGVEAPPVFQGCWNAVSFPEKNSARMRRHGMKIDSAGTDCVAASAGRPEGHNLLHVPASGP